MEAYPREGLERKETEVTATSPAKGWAGRNCIVKKAEPPKKHNAVPQFERPDCPNPPWRQNGVEGGGWYSCHAWP